MTSKMWNLSYEHDGLPFGLTLWGEEEEIESHAANLGMTIDGECVHIEDEETGVVEYTTGGVQ